MKLLDIYDDPDFKISENPIKVKKTIIEIMEKHAYVCSSNSFATVSNIATYLAKKQKKYMCNKLQFKCKELNFLQQKMIIVHVPEVDNVMDTPQQVCWLIKELFSHSPGGPWD